MKCHDLFVVNCVTCFSHILAGITWGPVLQNQQNIPRNEIPRHFPRKEDRPNLTLQPCLCARGHLVPESEILDVSVHSTTASSVDAYNQKWTHPDDCRCPSDTRFEKPSKNPGKWLNLNDKRKTTQLVFSWGPGQENRRQPAWVGNSLRNVLLFRGSCLSVQYSYKLCREKRQGKRGRQATQILFYNILLPAMVIKSVHSSETTKKHSFIKEKYQKLLPKISETRPSKLEAWRIAAWRSAGKAQEENYPPVT